MGQPEETRVVDDGEQLVRVHCSRCGTALEGYVRGDGAIMVNGKDSAEFGCPACNPHSNWTADHIRLLEQTSDPDTRLRVESGLEEPCPYCGEEMGAHELTPSGYECPITHEVH